MGTQDGRRQDTGRAAPSRKLMRLRDFRLSTIGCCCRRPELGVQLGASQDAELATVASEPPAAAAASPPGSGTPKRSFSGRVIASARSFLSPKASQTEPKEEAVAVPPPEDVVAPPVEFVLTAPPGKIGIGFEGNGELPPTVNKVLSTSPFVDQIQVGWALVKLDGADVTKHQAQQVINLLNLKLSQVRVLSFDMRGPWRGETPPAPREPRPPLVKFEGADYFGASTEPGKWLRLSGDLVAEPPVLNGPRMVRAPKQLTEEQRNSEKFSWVERKARGGRTGAPKWDTDDKVESLCLGDSDDDEVPLNLTDRDAHLWKYKPKKIIISIPALDAALDAALYADQALLSSDAEPDDLPGPILATHAAGDGQLSASGENVPARLGEVELLPEFSSLLERAPI